MWGKTGSTMGKGEECQRAAHERGELVLGKFRNAQVLPNYYHDMADYELLFCHLKGAGGQTAAA